MKTLVAVDWFQIGVHSHRGEKPINSPLYEVKNSDLKSRHFSIIEYIFAAKRLIATIQREPHSKVIPKGTILIKFENDFLYHKCFKSEVEFFLKENGLEFKNISRIDFCIDFNYFSKKMHPEKLIKRFVRLNYLKLGRGKFSIHGETNYTNTFQYLRFGRNTSDISVYLYNKTKEMAEVKNKPWIKDTWIESGLNVNEDVWRLEFSIKNSCKQIIDTPSGTYIDFKILSVLDEKVKEEIFRVLVKKYFTFFINDYKKNKSRMKRVKLFDNFKTTFQILDLTEKKESSRASKIFIKALNELNNELKGTADDLAEMGIDVKKYFIASRGLEQWAFKKDFIN